MSGSGGVGGVDCRLGWCGGGGMLNHGMPRGVIIIKERPTLFNLAQYYKLQLNLHQLTKYDSVP